MSFIQKIIVFIKKAYRVDYLAHLLAGILLAETFFTLAHIFHGNFLYYLIGAIVAIAVIFFKDYIDDKIRHKGTFEKFDIIMGITGVILVVIQWLFLLI